MEVNGDADGQDGDRVRSPGTNERDADQDLDEPLTSEQTTTLKVAIQKSKQNGVLDMSSQGWSHLPLQACDRTQITTLKLSRNKLSHLPNRIKKLRQLKELHIDSNKFRGEFPQQLKRVPWLKSLNIQGNGISHLSSHLEVFRYMLELRCGDNSLQSLHPSIGSLAHLAFLDVSFNQLAALPPELGNCTSLTVLRARGNQLKTIPSEVAKLKKMEELLIDQNPLVRLPALVATMPLRQIAYDIDTLQYYPDPTLEQTILVFFVVASVLFLRHSSSLTLNLAHFRTRCMLTGKVAVAGLLLWRFAPKAKTSPCTICGS